MPERTLSAPGAITIASKLIEVDPDVMERVKAACAAEWPAFLPRFGGPLQCYERVQPWWRRHRLVDVHSPVPAPAVSLPVVFVPGGAIRVLRGHPEHVVEMARTDPPRNLDLPSHARAYATFCGEMTSDAEGGEQSVDSFDQIPFRTSLAPAERELIKALRVKHAADIHAPKLEKTAAGFVLEMWMVSRSRLIHRKVVVPRSGQLTREEHVLADPIPVF